MCTHGSVHAGLYMCVYVRSSVTLLNTEKEEGKEKTQKAGGETRKRRKRKGKGGRKKRGYILNVYLCKNTYPHLFPQPIHTIDNDHSNDRYQNIRLRLTGNHFSHRQQHCGIIYQKTYSEQNQLVKLNTSSPEMTQIPRLSFTTVVEKHR